jgi:transcriptional regulator with XRE-family HTH domain
MQRKHSPRSAGLRIDGIAYMSADQVAKAVGVSRTTLWRWRQGRKVPAGLRYRDRLILYTLAEVNMVRDYAHRLAPADPRPVAVPVVGDGTRGTE